MQLARQFVASIHFIHRYHNREILGPHDKIQEVKAEQDLRESQLQASSTTLSSSYVRH